MKIKKKGISATGVIIGLALGIVLLFALITLYNQFFGKGNNQANLALYKTSCDYDGDTITVGDTCPCDPGKLTDSKIYWLKDKPDCMITISADGSKYLFDSKLSASASLKTCQDVFGKIYSAPGADSATICGQNPDIGQGIGLECAKKVLASDPSSNAFLTRCAKTDKECDNLLLSYCKDKV